MRKTERVLTALLLGLSVWLSGCTAVAPWERGNLAKPQMALVPNPTQEALREHAYQSREAAAAWGQPSGGGGCGCY